MADFRIVGPFGQYGALPKKRQQIQISESVKDAYNHGETNVGLGMVAEDSELERLEEKSRRQAAELLRLNQKIDNLSSRLQRAEELLAETRQAYIKDGTLQARKIDAYFGGHHGD